MPRIIQPSDPFLPSSSSLRKSISYFPQTRSSIIPSGAKKDLIPSLVVHALQTLLISALTIISPEITLSF